MPNLCIKCYHGCVCTGKNTVYIGFSTVCGYIFPMNKGGTTVPYSV